VNIPIAIRIEQDAHEQLQLIAAIRNRSVNAEVADAVEAHLERYQAAHLLALTPKGTA
jgi:predicted HicB family RNase H-like nuclease